MCGQNIAGNIFFSAKETEGMIYLLNPENECI